MQPDGKIVLVGFVTPDGNTSVDARNFLVIRLTADGAYDTTFGSGGVAQFDLCGGRDEAYAVALRSDGKIVVAGLAAWPAACPNGNPQEVRMAALLLSADGLTVEASQGYRQYANAFAVATSVVIQGTGEIVVAGCTGTSGANDACDFTQDYTNQKSSDILVVRWNAALNGLDASFNFTGARSLSYTSAARESARSLVLDGTAMVVSGFTWDATNSRFQDVVARLKANGSYDTAFNGSGYRLYPHGGKESLAMASRLDEGRGMLVIVDGSKPTGTENRYYYGTLRLSATTGAFDTTFSGDGHDQQAASADPGNDVARGIDVDPATGAVVVGGATAMATGDAMSTLLDNADGTVDTGFNGGGWQSIYFGGAVYNRCNAVAFQTPAADGLGRVLCAGWAGGGCTLNERQDECPGADAIIVRMWR